MSKQDGPPFVGRQAELRLFEHAIEAVKQGDCGVVVVAGHAGVGKTRLASEVARLAVKAGVRVMRGRATERAIAYRPLSEVLLSGLRQVEPPDDAALEPYRAALSHLVPVVGRGHPHRRPADASPVVIAEGVLRLLTRMVVPQGCLVVLDDLHNADEDTLAVVEYLCDNLAGSAILLVALLRTPGGAAHELALRLAQRGAATLLGLGGLGDGEIDELAAAVLGTPVDTIPAVTAVRLHRETLGVPLYVEAVCQMAAGSAIPDRMVHHARTLATGLGPAAAALLRAACILGRPFRLSVAGGIAELGSEALIEALRTAVAAGLLAGAGDRDLYAFRHWLVREALRAGLLPTERAELARRAARAMEKAGTVPTRESHEFAAEMWLEAGDVVRAAAQLYQAGRISLAQGAVEPASSLLSRALGLAEGARADDDLAADIVDALLDLHLAIGRLWSARELASRAGLAVDRSRRAARHGRLARAFVRAKRWNDARVQLEQARSLLTAGSDVETQAFLDAVHAHLLDGDPAADSAAATAMARRALHTATAAELPEVACQALEVLGDRARPDAPAEAQQHYERALEIATEFGLTAWRAHLLYRLGCDDADRSGGLQRLSEAYELASAAGATVTGLSVTAKLALVRLSEGSCDEAVRLAALCCRESGPAEYPELGVMGLGIQVCAEAHRGRRPQMEPLLTAFQDAGGDRSSFGPLVWGFGLACCSLLGEDRERAFDELEHALALHKTASPGHASLAVGPHLLLGTLRGSSGWPEYKAAASSPWAPVPWNRRFLLLGSAVLHGRQGHAARAAVAVQEFAAIGVRQPLAHHLGLRLVAEAAAADGWGDPAPWLREAEAYFRVMPAPSVVAACRALIRRCGAPAPQQRDGIAEIPPGLRRLGVTVREHEVLQLLGAGLNTRDIARQLYLSPRTIEKHVANLLTKTGRPDRASLARYAGGSR